MKLQLEIPRMTRLYCTYSKVEFVVLNTLAKWLLVVGETIVVIAGKKSWSLQTLLERSTFVNNTHFFFFFFKSVGSKIRRNRILNRYDIALLKFFPKINVYMRGHLLIRTPFTSKRSALKLCHWLTVGELGIYLFSHKDKITQVQFNLMWRSHLRGRG